MKSTMFSPQNLEATTNELWTHQGPQMVRVKLTNERSVIAWKGSMVAYQGTIDFDHKGSGSLSTFFKRALSSDNVPLMSVTGDGEVFLAAEAANVHLLHLEGESITLNGSSLLAFDDSLTYDLELVTGFGIASSGLWNTTLSGHGTAVIATVGHPLVLDCSTQATYTDVHATVGWAANLSPTLQRTSKAKALIGLGSGEAVQYAFHGPGFVIVQPFEGRGNASSSNSGGSTGLFDLLG